MLPCEFRSFPGWYFSSLYVNLGHCYCWCFGVLPFLSLNSFLTYMSGLICNFTLKAAFSTSLELSLCVALSCPILSCELYPPCFPWESPPWIPSSVSSTQGAWWVLPQSSLLTPWLGNFLPAIIWGYFQVYIIGFLFLRSSLSFTVWGPMSWETLFYIICPLFPTKKLQMHPLRNGSPCNTI